MSRIGRMPIAIPQGVTVNIGEDEITISGPKGKLQRHISHEMSVSVADNTLTVKRPTDARMHRSLHGLTRSLLANMVEGVTKGFEKELEITGVGYRVEKAGDKLVFRLGYSHPVEVSPMPGVSFGVEGNTKVKVIGIDKETVGEMSARLRALRPLDTFKGKGIKYAGERVILKAGKAGKVAKK
ncbi:MAG: 50S ribosomal protein L6 [Chloroflexi bacterium]|nr:50S ribosomal protein L6 [Chloroflexota bacterium]